MKTPDFVPEGLDLKGIINKIKKKWYYFVIALFVAMPLAYFKVKTSPAIYAVKGTILLDDKSSDALNSEKFMKELKLLNDGTELEDEIGLLTSYSLMKQAARQSGLGINYFREEKLKKTQVYVDHAPFEVIVDSSKAQMINTPIYITLLPGNQYRIRIEGEQVGLYNLHNEVFNEIIPQVNINETYKVTNKPEDALPFYLIFNPSREMPIGEEVYYFVIKSVNDVATSFQKKIKAFSLSNDSHIVELSSEGPVFQIEQEFINTLMDVYLQNELNQKQELGLKTMRFIDQQIFAVSDSLKKAEGNLESFRESSEIVDVASASESLSSQLVDVRREQSRLQRQLKYYQYMLTTLKSSTNASEVVAPSAMEIRDPLLNNLLVKLAEQQQQRVELSFTATDNNQQLQQLDTKIANTKAALIENVTNMVKSTQIALGDVNSQLGQVRGNLGRLPSSERKLVQIERQFNLSDQIYNYLLQKRAEAGIALAGNTINKRVVDAARLQGQVAPKPALIYGGAFFAALFLPLIFIFARDMVNTKIEGETDLSSTTQIPIIGYVLQGGKNEGLIGTPNSNRALAESFRAIRVTLQYLITKKKDRMVIGVTSSQSGEGKTFCAANLSVVLAQSGKKTLLVDIDLRKPKYVQYYQEGSNKMGLSTYLTGLHNEFEIVQATHVDNLHIVPSGPVAANPIDLITSNRMDQFFDQMKERYEYIIVDSPPLGLVSDYLVLKEFTDYNIYVVRHGKTSTDALNQINDLYNSGKIQDLGILINGVKSISAYGYNDGSYGYYLGAGDAQPKRK
ncbi:MAG: polysaccharide biosynthesis tyrosine autokinase [Bacteroidota bacterium]